MKSILHLLLGGYVLLLSVLPCADGFVPLRSNGKQAMISAHQHPIHPSDGDYCSPFCACNCCGTVLDLDTLPQFEFVSLPVTRFDCFAALNTKLLSLALPTWQPPCIG